MWMGRVRSRGRMRGENSAHNSTPNPPLLLLHIYYILYHIYLCIKMVNKYMELITMGSLREGLYEALTNYDTPGEPPCYWDKSRQDLLPPESRLKCQAYYPAKDAGTNRADGVGFQTVGELRRSAGQPKALCIQQLLPRKTQRT